MAFTVAQKQELEKAIASGVLTVKYAGPPERLVTYQSLSEMRDLLAQIRRELDGSSSRTRYATTSKGFGTCS